MYRLFDWGFAVYAVLIVEVDVVDAESLKAGGAGLLDVFLVTTHDHLAVDKCVGEFAGEEDLIASASLLEPAADELLVGKWSVDVCVPLVDSLYGMNHCY